MCFQVISHAVFDRWFDSFGSEKGDARLEKIATLQIEILAWNQFHKPDVMSLVISLESLKRMEGAKPSLGQIYIAMHALCAVKVDMPRYYELNNYPRFEKSCLRRRDYLKQQENVEERLAPFIAKAKSGIQHVYMCIHEILSWKEKKPEFEHYDTYLNICLDAINKVGRQELSLAETALILGAFKALKNPSEPQKDLANYCQIKLSEERANPNRPLMISEYKRI